MTKEEFNEKKEAFSAQYAKILIDYFLEYEWQKCIHIADYSSQFSSKRAKFELYNSNNEVIEPHWIINTKGKSMKLFPKETAMFSQEIKDFHQECQKDVPTRWNIWEFTLYPNGEYESSFTWDEEAYLEEFKKDAKGFFNLIHQEIDSCDIFFDEEGSSISWEEIMVIISFKSGKVEPLSIEIKSGENVIYHSEPIGDEYGEYRYQVSKQRYEDIYHLTNEGELKEKLSPKWNVATIHIKNGVRFDFEKHVIFEWREENA